MAKNILKDLHLKLFKKEENKNLYRIGLMNGHIFEFIEAELNAAQDLHIQPIAVIIDNLPEIKDWPNGLTIRHDDVSWIADLAEKEEV